MRKVLYAIGALVIILIIGIVALPFLLPILVPTDELKAEATRQASDSLGREVTVNGPVRWSVFPHLALEVSDVSIANAPGGDAKTMAQLGKVAIDLEVLPLLSGDVILDRLELVDPVLNLEIDKQGRANWDFDQGKGAKPTASELKRSPAAPETAPKTPPQTASSGSSSIQLDQLRLDDIRLENGTVSYLDQRSNERRLVQAINAKVSLPALDRKLSFDGSLVWNGKKIGLALGLDNPRAFSDGNGSALSVSLQGDPIAVGFKGMGGLKPATALTGDVDLKIPSIRGLADWAGAPIKGGSPDTMGLLAITGKLAIADKVTSFTGATFQLDQISATIKQLSVDSSGARPAIKGDLAVQLLDLDPYMAPPGGAPAPPAAAAPAAKGGSDWSDAPIDVSALKSADLDLTLAMTGLKAEKVAIGQSGATVQLKDGKLTAVLNQMALYQGTGTGQLVLDGSGAVPALQLTAKLDKIAVQQFLKDAVAVDRLSGTGNFDIAVAGKGKSQREIISSLDGKGAMTVANGAIQGIDLAAMAKNVETAFTQAVSGGAQKTDFASLGGTFTIAAGIVKNQDLDMKSPAFEIAGAGTVDLPRRQIDYRLTPKNASGNAVAVPILVQGPLDNPSYRPDLGGALQQGLSNPGQLLNSLKGGSQTGNGQQQPGGSNAVNALKGLLGH
jgi:AsmA protein